MESAVSECEHHNRSLLNPWELVRKYVCADCSAVMTCACDGELVTYVVPHQAMRGHDDRREEIAVTHPLVPGICGECRGEVPAAHPKAAHRGAASLIRRYYWREIWRETELSFLAWRRVEGLPLFDSNNRTLHFTHVREHREKYDELHNSVVERMKSVHAENPKYDFTRPSDADILNKYEVNVESVKACYVPNSSGPARVLPLGGTDPSQAVQVEEFLAKLIREQGREAMFCESRPFQALYGSLMWLWVQSPQDPRLRVCMFGGRDGVGADERGLIWTQLPHDFGSPAHARRRSEALVEHLNLVPEDTDEMLWAYDYWQEPSRPLRQYLWAYTEEDRARARELIRILGAPRVKLIMHYLADAYWKRYLGWPDLLSWQERPDGPKDIEFIEVKSSSDKLSDDQRDWIKGNYEHLRLPFRIVKVHRTQRLGS